MWHSLRTDTDAFSTGAIVGPLVGIMVAILIGIILLPVIANQQYLLSKNVTTVGNATRTGIPGATGLISLPALLFLVTVVVISAAGALFLIKQVE